jgi:hypothetical protein
MVRFSATLAAARDEAGRWVECPFNGRAEFGEARAPVVGTVNGTPFRSRLMVYGGITYLGFTHQVRSAAGIDVGSELQIELSRDDAPREVPVPAELAAALASEPAAQAAFDRLSFTHRREYAQWVDEAKRAETRDRRSAKAVQMLRDGIRHP